MHFVYFFWFDGYFYNIMEMPIHPLCQCWTRKNVKISTHGDKNNKKSLQINNLLSISLFICSIFKLTCKKLNRKKENKFKCDRRHLPYHLNINPHEINTRNLEKRIKKKERKNERFKFDSNPSSKSVVSNNHLFNSNLNSTCA